MHIYSNKIILKNNDRYVSNDILIKIIESNIEYIKINCKFLYEYYMYIKSC